MQCFNIEGKQLNQFRGSGFFYCRFFWHGPAWQRLQQADGDPA